MANFFYEQSEGMAKGSPLGPLMVKTFMCSLEEQLKLRDKFTIILQVLS